MVDALMASPLSETISYQSGTLGELTFQAIPVEIDPQAETGRFSSRRIAKAFECRVSDLATAKSGDQLTYNGVTFELQSDGYHPDGDDLLWRIECYAV